MGEPKRMSDFVRDDKTDQLAFQIVRQGEGLSTRVAWGRLDEIPVADEFLDVARGIEAREGDVRNEGTRFRGNAAKF